MINETCLDETMLDIKEITNQTTSEDNATLNETIQSASTPEIEHRKMGITQETPIPCMDLQTWLLEETRKHEEI